jgi:hypothetical protein
VTDRQLFGIETFHPVTIDCHEAMRTSERRQFLIGRPAGGLAGGLPSDLMTALSGNPSGVQARRSVIQSYRSHTEQQSVGVRD